MALVPAPSVDESGSCTDTEDGVNYTIRGVVSSSEGEYEDTCSDDKTLKDYYCEGNTVLKEKYECPGSCQNGVCSDEVIMKDEKDDDEMEKIESSCEDSEDEVDYFERGVVTYNGEEYPDTCVDNLLKDYYCEGNTVLKEKYECSLGCGDGECIGTGVEIEVEDKPIKIPNEEDSDEVDYVCNNGCELEDKCYPIGYRMDGSYCSDDFEFTNQTVESESCDNNFECKSNVCVSDECVSGGLIKNIINWFKRVFGGE